MNKKLLKPNLLGGGVKLLTITILASFQVFSQTPPNQQNSLNASGYVGVGTTNPDSKLQVNGNMSVDSSLTVRDTAVFEKQARMKDKIIVEGDAVIKGKLTAKDNFKVLGTAKMEGNVKMTALPNANANDTSLLFINANGKVTSGGIIALLDVIASNPQALAHLTNSVYEPPVSPYPCSLANPVWRNKPDVLWTGTGIGGVPCPVKVGIGTGNPTSTFHNMGDTRLVQDVVADAHLAVGNSVSIGSTSTNSFSKLSVKNTNRPASLQIDARGNTLNYQKLLYMQFDGSNNTELIKIEKSNESDPRFLLRGDGSFYIYNGTKKLLQMDNVGLLHGRRVIVDQTVWPDYVFHSSFVLPPLSETDNFIKENGHLPGVPSAEEVTTNGLDLGEMNKILLQKVEELTLYAIQQQKEIEELKLKVDQIEVK